MSLAILRSVSKKYTTTTEAVFALNHISLDVVEGEVTAIVGVSGSGKSSLLGAMAGLIRIDEGSIVVSGVELAGQSFDELSRIRRDVVSLIFQEYNLMPSLTVLDNAALPALIRGESRIAAEHSAIDALKLMGISAKRDDYPGSLSGGQRQRVAIARSLAGQHSAGRLILADEPTGALDSKTGADVMEALRTAANAGAGVVIATHDPSIERDADNVVRLLDGRVIEASTSDALA